MRGSYIKRWMYDFALTDSRIRVFSKPNGGLVDATIYGVNQATGEYIAFLDPDDYIR